MDVLLLRSNDPPSLRILYFCLLTYNSNIEVPSALSGPGAFPPSPIGYSTVNSILCNICKSGRRILTLSTV